MKKMKLIEGKDVILSHKADKNNRWEYTMEGTRTTTPKRARIFKNFNDVSYLILCIQNIIISTYNQRKIIEIILHFLHSKPS